MRGNPNEYELLKIKDWNLMGNGVYELLRYVRSLWNLADTYFLLKGEWLELHTGGWLSNENIIIALMRNKLFWNTCWQKSERGGHYFFAIRRDGFI